MALFDSPFPYSSDFFNRLSEYAIWFFLLKLKSNNRLEHVKTAFHPGRLFP
jgi:hypothetical protein